MASYPLIAAQRLSKQFGAVVALRDVSLEVAPGEVRAICGENGAGKSTLVRILTGVHAPDAGVVMVDGAPHKRLTPQSAQALGIALVAQELSLAPHLSVLDNIWLGSNRVPLFHRRRKFRHAAAAALDTLGVGDLNLDRSVATLGMGERQLVEIARGLARDARVLILDEPTATISDIEIRRLFAAIRALRAAGRAVLYITHRLGEVFEICDTVTVMRNGEHVATCGAAELDRDRLIEMMLGRQFADMYPAPDDSERSDVALHVERMHIPGAVHEFSFAGIRGKIVCIAGQLGSGASVVTRAIAGLVPDARGRVLVDGAALVPGAPPRALAANVLFISEDRAGEGLFPRMRVLDNLVALQLSQHARCGVLSWRALRAFAARLADRVRIDRARLGSRAAELSGGNQQKLLFGRALERDKPGVLLMNEPTRGVDVGARAEIYRLMRQFCAAGWSLVMTSSDLEEVVGIADIVHTMYRGRAVRRYEGAEITMPAILADITHPAQAA